MFKGSAVAIITPFLENGKIDYESLEKIIEFQIENKTDAIVVAGTTGEASTLSDEEHIAIIDFCVKKVNKRVTVIAGTGSNDTNHGVNLSKMAQEVGADALLQVTPYYNKTSNEGLKRHFLEIANSVDIPIILYSVPGRTNINIPPELVLELSKHKNIVGIKDATGNISYTEKIRKLCGKDFLIYSGNDDINVPIISATANGVISVFANIFPKQTKEMVDLALKGEIKEAMKLQIKYLDFIESLFLEPNPIPIKYIMSKKGYCKNILRLPLYKASENIEKIIDERYEEVK